MLNNWSGMGRLTADPELKQTNSGKSTVTFNIAIDRNYSKNEDRKADFITCYTFGKTAEFICKYFNKGDFIVICNGELRSRTYDDKNGSRHYIIEAYAKEVSFAGGKSERRQETRQDEGPVDVVLDEIEVLSEDGVPF